MVDIHTTAEEALSEDLNMLTLYNVISQDWFIADKNGSEEFIPDELWPTTLETIKKFDVLVMGRKTYETIQAYPEGNRAALEALPIRKIVITKNNDFHPKQGYEVLHTADEIAKLNANVLVSSGPTLNNSLLKERLVDMVIVHQLPVSVGNGTPVFDPTFQRSLTLESERGLPPATECIYSVV